MSVHYDADSLLATAKIRFVPLPEDNGKYLACRTVNEYFPSEPKEDGYIVNVNCKFQLIYISIVENKAIQFKEVGPNVLCLENFPFTFDVGFGKFTKKSVR